VVFQEIKIFGIFYAGSSGEDLNTVKSGNFVNCPFRKKLLGIQIRRTTT